MCVAQHPTETVSFPNQHCENILEQARNCQVPVYTPPQRLGEIYNSGYGLRITRLACDGASQTLAIHVKDLAASMTDGRLDYVSFGPGVQIIKCTTPYFVYLGTGPIARSVAMLHMQNGFSSYTQIERNTCHGVLGVFDLRCTANLGTWTPPRITYAVRPPNFCTIL